MDTARALALVEQLDEHTDDLEDVLQPIFKQSLTEVTKKLPLLDKAKLHIVIVYAIESLLFSYLKLKGVDAKEHPVFRELTRVKQYFEKVKAAEETGTQAKEKLVVDKDAVARMIKHSLAGNDKFDLERLEREAKEKLLAKRKLMTLEATMKAKAAHNEEAHPAIDQIAAEIVAANEQELQQDNTSASNANTATEDAIKKDKKRKRKQDDNGEWVNKPRLTKSEKKALKKAKRDAKETEAANDMPS